MNRLKQLQMASLFVMITTGGIAFAEFRSLPVAFLVGMAFVFAYLTLETLDDISITKHARQDEHSGR